MEKELELILKVEQVQAEQGKYFAWKRKGMNSTQQLELCKKLEADLKNYCAKRKKELNDIQTKLF